MGYSASTVVIVGVYVDKTLYEKKSKVRGCKHKESSSRFCPECGKPIWVEKVEEVDFDDIVTKSGDEELTFTYCEAESSREAIVGYCLSKLDTYTGKIHKINMATNMEKYRERLKKLLGDLWSEKDFGMYCVFQESY